MFSDGSSFMKRAAILRRELEKQSYPSARDLARLAECSRSTAQRTINRLREEYLLPVSYDSSKKGYCLKDKSFSFEALPPGKDELTSLLLMRELTQAIGDPEIKEGIAALWCQYQAQNSASVCRLEDLGRYFSSDFTEVAVLADSGAITFLNYAARGEDLRVTYFSPWRHTEAKQYEGRIGKVHFSDGNLYILFFQTNGDERILNTSFIEKLEILDRPGVCQAEGEPVRASNWLSGFGMWAGGELEEVEISILPPAAKYFAKQRWDDTQEDTWEGEVLIRRMQSIISPELIRHILGLGKLVRAIKPETLRLRVLDEARGLVANVGG